MKFEILIVVATMFLIANTYHDGKYVTLLKSWKKYYQMIGIAFVGLSSYAYIKKYPSESRGFLQSATSAIRHMPLDRETGDFLTPIMNITTKSLFGTGNMSTLQANPNPLGLKQERVYSPQQKRMLNSGGNSTKRSVSETKKKYVASQQDWKCKNCSQKLPAWFEVDHKIRLERGGSNHIDNLVALCRDCHGKKTAFENF